MNPNEPFRNDLGWDMDLQCKPAESRDEASNASASGERETLEAKAWGEQYVPGMSQREAQAFKRGHAAGWRDARTVQGEPTDAALDAALDAWFRAVDEGEYSRNAMHAALLAAALSGQVGGSS